MRKIFIVVLTVLITSAFVGCSASSHPIPQPSIATVTPAIITPETSPSASEHVTPESIMSPETPVTQNTSTIYNDELCAADEDVLLSFQVENSQKVLSVCVAKDQSYIVYRYGTANHIELEYPADKTDSWSKFKYSNYTDSDGTDCQLSFENGGYQYEIGQYNSVDSENPEGIDVTVTDLANPATASHINGQSDSVIGSLLSLQGNTKIGPTTYTMLLYKAAPNAQIQYPHFYDKRYDEVNQIIYHYVLNFIAGFDLDVPISEDTSVTISYHSNVTLQNSKMISVIFWGESYYSRAAHPNAGFATLNIDLATLKEVTLTDMYTINADFEKVFYAKAQQVSGVEGAFQFSQSYNSSSLDPFTNAEVQYDIPCYLTPYGLVISLGIVHVAGDHFEAQLKYSDIQQFYKLNQNYWEN